jgi:hypothetical protein
MDIDKAIQDIADYFKAKLVKGEFEFLRSDIHTATILIGGRYEFEIWISNRQPDNLAFYSSFPFDRKTGVEDFFQMTWDEKRKAWKHLGSHVRSYKHNQLIKTKENELEKLKEELQNLKNK